MDGLSPILGHPSDGGFRGSHSGNQSKAQCGEKSRIGARGLHMRRNPTKQSIVHPQGNSYGSRQELYDDIVETLGITRVFVAMTILSAVVAAAGLLRNDVAVIVERW
jgi:hypothetical protein